MNQIEYAMLMHLLGIMALLESIFMLSTIRHNQHPFILTARIFSSFGMYLIHLELFNRFA